jgi:hypothetical protein
MLMGLIELGPHHAQRAAVAMRLVPGEFHRRFVDRVTRGALRRRRRRSARVQGLIDEARQPMLLASMAAAAA